MPLVILMCDLWMRFSDIFGNLFMPVCYQCVNHYGFFSKKLLVFMLHSITGLSFVTPQISKQLGEITVKAMQFNFNAGVKESISSARRELKKIMPKGDKQKEAIKKAKV